jgi:hypothetical protein
VKPGKPTQAQMFTDGADLPLFSATPQRVALPRPDAAPSPMQASYAHCRACLDTGRIGQRRCWCPAGQ